MKRPATGLLTSATSSSSLAATPTHGGPRALLSRVHHYWHLKLYDRMPLKRKVQNTGSKYHPMSLQLSHRSQSKNRNDHLGLAIFDSHS